MMKPTAVARLAVLVVSSFVVATAAAQSAGTAAGRAPSGVDSHRVAPGDIARASERLQQPPATRIYRSVLPDGRVVLSDVPVPAARSVESRAYALPAPNEAQLRAAAERAYWRQQAEGFEQRRRERLRGDREQELDVAVIVDADARRRVVAAAAPPPAFVVAPAAVPPVYTSSPGAAQGRGAPFIGSGFSRAAR